MRGGATRRNIANRIQRLERSLWLTESPYEKEFDTWPTMTLDQLEALLGDAEDAQRTLGNPICILQDPRLVQWLRRAYPDRLEQLKQAHARGEPAPPWNTTKDESEQLHLARY